MFRGGGCVQGGHNQAGTLYCGDPHDRRTDVTDNITFPQLRWRAIKLIFYYLIWELLLLASMVTFLLMDFDMIHGIQ